MKKITKKAVLEAHNKSPKRRCFAIDSGIKWGCGKFCIPFLETIKPIFQKETKLKLLYDSNSYNNINKKTYYCNISETEFTRVLQWEKKHGNRVFLRDCLFLSIALDFNRIGNVSRKYTEIGKLEKRAKELEKRAKKDTDSQDIVDLTDLVHKNIIDLPYYKDADYICAIPSSKEFNLPKKVTSRVSKKINKPDITSWFHVTDKKQSVKDVDYSDKWDLWEKSDIKFNPDCDITGKSVILIDDKYQSGITIQYIAMKLQEAGAKEVYGLCFVKTLRDDDNSTRHNMSESDTLNKEPRIKEIAIDDVRYPAQFKEFMSKNSLKSLFIQGNEKLLQLPGIGFCGSRKASEKSLEITRDIAEQSAKKNYAIISGYAVGVDSVAHYSALNSGGNTIIVLPEGIDYFRIKKQYKDIWEWNRILVISQFHPSEPWKVYRAMQRNTLVIALSRAVIVIEAGETGGTLKAGEQTLEPKSHAHLFVVDNEDAIGNKKLLAKDANRIAKNIKTNKANLKNLFSIIDENKPPEPKQPDLPYEKS